MTKKRAKRKKKNFDIDIKVNNLEKVIKAGMEKHKKKCHCQEEEDFGFLALLLQ